MVRKEGKDEGLSEGREAGLIDGRVEEKKEGLSEGREIGLIEGRKAVARSLLEKGMAEAEIAEVTGLTPEEVAALGQEMSHCE